MDEADMQARPETIRILSDDPELVKIKGALPVLHDIAKHVNEIGVDALQDNLTHFMSSLESMLGSTTASMKSFAMKEVKIAVAVNGAGQFSLLGSKASADLKATFEITLIPKPT